MPSAIILFGAFDRHNFGDLLFAHIAAALLPGADLAFAGLVTRDLTPVGGHLVHALPQLVARRPDRPVLLIHAGGELLTCEAWQAAVMVQPAEGLQAALAYLEARPALQHGWLRTTVGTDELAPYVVSRARLPPGSRVIHLGTGGVALDTVAPAMRREVLAKLADADAVGVRDHVTQAHLAAAGIGAQLIPDPAVMVAELFGQRIRAAGAGEFASLLDGFAQGYLAVQFSADFGDDATLDAIAARLDQVAAETGLGIVFFRAGAAPWHDALDVFRRAAARMRTSPARVFESLDLWDICAVIAHSRGFCGSSLHGRIVATAFALPRVSLARSAEPAPHGKQSAYAATWEDDQEMPGVVAVHALDVAVRQALATDHRRRAATAKRLAAAFRQAFEQIRHQARHRP